MLSWVIITLGLGTTWYCSDVSSPSSLYNIVCPVLFFVFLISLIVKMVLWMRRHNMSNDTGGWGNDISYGESRERDSGSGGFFSGGGDSSGSSGFGGDSGGGGD